MGQVNWASFLELADMLPRARRTFVIGRGRSGLVARSFGMRLMHAGLPAFIPGETITPAAGDRDLLVAISCTGSTGMTDYVAARAKQLGAKVVALTSDASSPLAKLADKVVAHPRRRAQHRPSCSYLRTRRQPQPRRRLQRALRPPQTRSSGLPRTTRQPGVKTDPQISQINTDKKKQKAARRRSAAFGRSQKVVGRRGRASRPKANTWKKRPAPGEPGHRNDSER